MHPTCHTAFYYEAVNTVLNNMRHTTKTVQKQTKPCNENNRATRWKKTTLLSYTTASVCTEKNRYSDCKTTQNEKKNVKMKTDKLV